ncbi:MAG: hypothetical protein JST40_00385 [Armatimonadetes bacterium]|nr:hypothetical protein [Armatimonadota bacterium]
MKSMYRVGLLPALLTLMLVAHAGEATYGFKRTAKVGDELVMKINVELTIEDQQATIAGKSRSKVVKVESDGTIVEESKDEDLKFSVAGQEFPIPQEDAKKITYDPRGFVKEIEGDETEALDYRMSNLTLFVRPEKEVKVGESWTVEFKENAKTKIDGAKGEFKLEAIETVSGAECGKVTYKYAETSGSKPMSAEGTMWIRLKDGLMIKLNADGKNVPLEDEEHPNDLKFTMELE